MQSRRFVSTFTLAVVVATTCASMSTSASAGGYGSRSGGDYSFQRSRTHAREIYQGGNQHLRWCYSQFKTYRESDNTFQPYSGPRRECVSPYDADRRKLFADRNSNHPESLFRIRPEGSGDLVRRDSFGNLPEVFRGGEGIVDGDRASRDRFGNLPERPAVQSDVNTAVEQGQPLAEAVETPASPAEPPVAANAVDPETDAETAQDATSAPQQDAEAPADAETGTTVVASDNVESKAETQDPAAGEE